MRPSFTPRLRCFLASSVVFSGLAMVETSYGQFSKTWEGLDANYNSAGNWSPVGVPTGSPGAGDDARISNTNSPGRFVPVLSDGSNQAVGRLFVGYGNSDVAQLDITSGTITAFNNFDGSFKNQGSILIGSNLSTGTVNMAATGAGITAVLNGDDSDLELGYAGGTGTLNIGAQSEFRSSGWINLGRAAAAPPSTPLGTGFLNVNSGGTLNHTGGHFRIGEDGAGFLTVDGIGSTVNHSSGDPVYFGTNTGSSGTGIIRNSGIWNQTGGQLLIANSASPTASSLSLQSGAAWNHSGGQIVVANAAGATGTLNIDGVNSVFNMTGNNNPNLSVGANGGNGTMNVTNGGFYNQTNGGDVHIGLNNGSVGMVSVASGGSFSTNNWVNIARGAGSSGTLNVTGATTTFTQTGGELNIGDDGAGVMTVDAGTVAHSGGTVHIGKATNSIGMAVLRNGAIWNQTSGDLRVANSSNSTGSLTLQSGSDWNHANGQISVANGAGSIGTFDINNATFDNSSGAGGPSLILGLNGGGATMSVTNGGSYIQTNGADINIGEANSVGTVNVNSGGRFDAFQWVNLARGGNSQGTMTVDGVGSVFNQTGDHLINIGEDGVGTLNVTNGAIYNAGSNIIFVGRNGGSVGTFNISGTVNVNDQVSVGENGRGVMNISGGTLNKTSAGGFLIANGANSNGTLVVSGTGTANIATDINLGLGGGSVSYLGVADTATLAITGHLTLGQNGGTNSTVNISGGTTTISDYLNIGQGGNGQYNQSGGTVSVSSLVAIGVGGGGTAEANLSGGTLNANAVLEVGSDRFATLHISGDAIINTNGTANFVLGLRNGGDGRVTQTGGTVNANNDIILANDGGSTGHYVQTGGALNAAGDLRVGDAGGANATFTHMPGTPLAPSTVNVDEIQLGNGGNTPLALTTGDVYTGSVAPVANAVNARTGINADGGTFEIGGDLFVRGTSVLDTTGDLNINTSSLGTAGSAGTAGTSGVAGNLVNSATATFGTAGTGANVTVAAAAGSAPGSATAANVNVHGDLAVIEGTANIANAANIGTNGSLVVNGVVNATNGVNVGSGGTLRGGDTDGNSATGRINSNVNILSDGSLSPGGDFSSLLGVGTLAFNGALVLNPGSDYTVDLLPMGISDRINMVTGTLALNGELIGNFTGTAGDVAMPGDPLSGSRYWIATNDPGTSINGEFVNAMSGNGDALGFFGSGAPGINAATSAYTILGNTPFYLFYNADFGTDGTTLGGSSFSGGNDLLLIAVPEPSRAMFLIAAAAYGLTRRRRSAKKMMA